MNTTIKYTNVFGEELTQQQKESSDEYVKAYYNNGTLVKRELFIEEELKSTTYQVASQSEIDTVLLADPNGGFIMKYNDGNISIQEEFEYLNGVLKDKKTYVINLNDDIICERRYALDSQGLEVKSHTEKFYYENGEERYFFEYKPDGSCVRICDSKYDESNIFGENIGNPALTSFTWVGFEYYQFADPIIPPKESFSTN